MRSLQSVSLKASRTSIFHPRCSKHCAANKASPALCPFPANTMHRPGFRKNFVTAWATPAPALFISASTWTPLANAASSAARICAEVKIGRFNQTSRSGDAERASEVDFFEELFFFRVLFLAERLDRLFLDLVTLVWSMYGCSGMLSAVATRVVPRKLATELRLRTPAAIASASF